VDRLSRSTWPFRRLASFQDARSQCNSPNELFETIAESTTNKHDALQRAIQDQFIEEVELSTCKKYLDKKIDERFRCRWNVPQMPLECPANTVAAKIESALYLDEAENRLDTLLQKAIEQRCSILEVCLERRRNVIDENKMKLFSRWASTNRTA
jgi:hypothetical protein